MFDALIVLLLAAFGLAGILIGRWMMARAILKHIDKAL